MSVTLEQLTTDLLDEAREDYVGVWVVIWHLRERMGVAGPEERRQLAMTILSQLLHRKLIIAGMPNSDGEFEQWEGSPDLIIERIAHEWSQLGHEPNLGEVAWFTSTD